MPPVIRLPFLPLRWNVKKLGEVRQLLPQRKDVAALGGRDLRAVVVAATRSATRLRQACGRQVWVWQLVERCHSTKSIIAQRYFSSCALVGGFHGGGGSPSFQYILGRGGAAPRGSRSPRGRSCTSAVTSASSREAERRPWPSRRRPTARRARPSARARPSSPRVDRPVVCPGDAGPGTADVVERGLDDVRRDADLGHARRGGPSQIVQAPGRDVAHRVVEPALELRPAADRRGRRSS